MKITITWECGEKTCATEPGKFCKFVKSVKYGQSWLCHLFEKDLSENDGWLMRCKECTQLSPSSKPLKGSDGL